MRMTEVLLVEDDASIRENLAALLVDEGFQVVAVANGQEAWERLQQAVPQLLLLDLMMPVMSGWQLREKMLRDPALATVPTIVLSGVDEGAGQVDTLHAAAYLGKPIDLDRLLDLLSRLHPDAV